MVHVLLCCFPTNSPKSKAAVRSLSPQPTLRLSPSFDKEDLSRITLLEEVKGELTGRCRRRPKVFPLQRNRRTLVYYREAGHRGKSGTLAEGKRRGNRWRSLG